MSLEIEPLERSTVDMIARTLGPLRAKEILGSPAPSRGMSPEEQEGTGEEP